MALLTGVLEVGAAYDVGLRLREIPAEGDAGRRGPVDQPQDRREGCRAVGLLGDVRADADVVRRVTTSDKRSQKLLE